MNERLMRIQVFLGSDEYAALLKAAKSEYRHPRDQVRAILRAALLGNQPDGAIMEKHNDAVRPLASEHGAVAATVG